MHGASRIGIASAKSARTSRTYWAMVIAGARNPPRTRPPSISYNTGRPSISNAAQPVEFQFSVRVFEGELGLGIAFALKPSACPDDYELDGCEADPVPIILFNAAQGGLVGPPPGDRGVDISIMVDVLLGFVVTEAAGASERRAVGLNRIVAAILREC
jgi:hypothetical protein